MAETRKLCKFADVYVGTHAVLRITSVLMAIPERAPILSDELHLTEPDVVGVGDATSPKGVDIEVTVDAADTNGQGALQAAFDAGTTIVLNFYPDGKTTGSRQWTGDAYVIKVPDVEAKDKKSAYKGTFKTVYATAPVAGVVAAV